MEADSQRAVALRRAVVAAGMVRGRGAKRHGFIGPEPFHRAPVDREGPGERLDGGKQVVGGRAWGDVETRGFCSHLQ